MVKQNIHRSLLRLQRKNIFKEFNRDNQEQGKRKNSNYLGRKRPETKPEGNKEKTAASHHTEHA